MRNMWEEVKRGLRVIVGYIEGIESEGKMGEEEGERLVGKLGEKRNEVIEMMNWFFDLGKLECEDKEMGMRKVDMKEIWKGNMVEYYEGVE